MTNRMRALAKQFLPLALLLGLLGLIALTSYIPRWNPTSLLGGDYPEVRELGEMLAGEVHFQDYQDYFRALADDKGAVYAFEVLKRAPLPPGTDLHLLGHTVGDMLYEQKGIDGIKDCTDDFRNACSHSVVIGILQDFGEGALPDIAAACKEAPGGRGAYTMCFHGLGHGVLAYNGYKLEPAIEMCKRTGTPEYQNREYIECAGGAAMEMMAGVHDRELWEQERDTYFKDTDPLYPCTADFMPDEARPICLVYLTPHLFETAGASLHTVDPAYYEPAMAFCDALPKDQPELRNACYGGFGKEYIVLVRERDIRDVGSMTAEQLKKVRDACALAPVDGERSCNGHALASLFWGGEANPDASFRFCEIAEGEDREACYAQLGSHIVFYLGGERRGTELCNRLPDPHRTTCLAGMR